MKPMSLMPVVVLALGVRAGFSEEIRPGVLRTPDERFANLVDYPFAPHYVEIEGFRVHYVDEGPPDAPPVLMLHGEPTWSYLYRKMIPIFADAGYRAIAPDLIGFGKSDKPVSTDAHTFKFHVDTMAKLLEELDLKGITLVCQDWGSLIGLRVAAENPDRFARIVLANGGLPTGDEPMPPAFQNWRAMANNFKERGDMPIGMLLGRQMGDPSLAAPYDAPFPDPTYKAGPLIMPLLVPITPDDPASPAQRAAWEIFDKWEKPFLTLFGDGDPITRGAEVIFQQRVPGAKGQPHKIIENAGHFIQEAKGDELANLTVEFIKSTSGQ